MPDNTNPIKEFFLGIGINTPFDDIIEAAFKLNAEYRKTMDPYHRFIVDAVLTQMLLNGFITIQDFAQKAGMAQPLPENWLLNLLEEAKEHARSQRLLEASSNVDNTPTG